MLYRVEFLQSKFDKKVLITVSPPESQEPVPNWRDTKETVSFKRSFLASQVLL